MQTGTGQPTSSHGKLIAVNGFLDPPQPDLLQHSLLALLRVLQYERVECLQNDLCHPSASKHSQQQSSSTLTGMEGSAASYLYRFAHFSYISLAVALPESSASRTRRYVRNVSQMSRVVNEGPELIWLTDEIPYFFTLTTGQS